MERHNTDKDKHRSRCSQLHGYRERSEERVILFCCSDLIPLHATHVNSGGLEVASPLRKSKVAGSTPGGVDRFSGSANRATETSGNITACVIERDISGPLHRFIEEFRRFRTRQHGHQ
ncbi:hypothetical protein TNCV_3511791 [Trichonephila clavipes]|nr:hypothetical protein TNCV_3511791 [Trichonephila clavipes]